MKINLLSFLMLSPILIFAQGPVKKIEVQGANQYAVPVSSVKAVDQATLPEAKPNSSSSKNKKAKNYNFVTLGETYYDLQTNSSPGRRIVLHDDGSISAVWTASPDDGTGFPNRGSGYNFNDGTTWLDSRSNKVESAGRTGWPSIMVLDDGSEAILAHESNTGGFVLSKNGTKGSANFTSSIAILDDVSTNDNRVPIWNRSAASNGKIHIVSNYWFSEDNGVPRVTRNGVQSPTTYSRWNISGDTAEVEHILLPGYDSTVYASGGGDTYAIDVRDSIVAILIGGLGDPISLWKSTDDGVNWTYTDVDRLPYKGERAAAELLLSGDTMYTNDGALDVMIDANGDVHAFWGLGRVLGVVNVDDATDTAFSFFPGQSQIRHWKEGDTESKIAGSPIDMDDDGELTITPETYSGLDVNGNVTAPLLSAARTGATSLVTMPSASMDADGNLFVVYSAPVETALHYLNANFRDIHVSYSTDGGATWSSPQNITQERTEECNFPNVAKMSNDFLHLIWQQDDTPGTSLQNNSPASGTHPTDLCRIHYAAVPVTDILNNVIGQNTLNAKEVNKNAEVFIVHQNRPNPFYGSTEVLIYLRSGSEVKLTVSDILGNVVKEGDFGTLGAGNHTITIDGNDFTSGMYFYTLTTGDHSVTRKMQVK